MRTSRGLSVFAFAAVLILSASAAAPTHPSSRDVVELLGHVPPAAFSEGPGRAVDPNAPVELVFVLRAGADAAGIAAWLAAAGFAVTPTRDPTLLRADADAGLVNAALDVALMARPGFVAPSRNPSLPDSWAGDVLAVVGLTAPDIATQNGSGTVDGAPPFVPAELRAAYGVDAIHDAGGMGAGVRIGITSWGPADPQALAEFSSAYGLPAATLTHHGEGGAASCARAGDPEWDLDVQMAHAMAPLAELHVYCARSPTFASLLVTLAELVADDLVDVVSQSWGVCESRVDSATAGVFAARLMTASAQGIAFFTASGDSGSRNTSAWGSSAIGVLLRRG